MAEVQKSNFISHVSDDAVLDGPPGTESYCHDHFPRFQCLSKTHGEIWLFDGVDPGTNAAVTVSFFREGSLIALGKGPLRTSFHAIFPDGCTVHGEDFANESIIRADGERIVGTWQSVNENGKCAGFEVRFDLSEAVVTFNLPALQGTLKLRRCTTNECSSSSPSTLNNTNDDVRSHSERDHVLGPGIHYAHSIPRAAAEVDFAFPGEGTRLQFSGYGGTDHSWMTERAPAVAEASTYARGHVGPYTFALLRIFSRLEPGKTYVKVVLAQDDGKELFSCASDDRISLTDDYASLRSTYSGQLTGDFSDLTSGYRLDLVSPSEAKHWSFELNHRALWWSMPTGGPPTAKIGNNGFVDGVTGGEVGGPIYTGAAIVGYCHLPKLKSEYIGFSNHSHDKPAYN